MSESTRPTGAGAALAVGDQNVEAPRNPITIYTQDATARAPGGLADQLVRRAQAQGQIRVIVGLRLTMRMEHTLTTAQATTQLRALQTVQSAVAARVLGSPVAQSEDRFTFIPFMSMFVNAAQLRRLLADPQVTSVQEDVPEPPTLAQSAPVDSCERCVVQGLPRHQSGRCGARHRRRQVASDVCRRQGGVRSMLLNHPCHPGAHPFPPFARAAWPRRRRRVPA